MALLFGGSGGSRGQSKHVVEFRAGKMTLKGTTVTPDKRKGLVYIYQAEDNLTHFCWKDRKSGTVEDDLILFPDDCEYKKVTQAKEGSRVYMLKFKASNRKLFFWMQEPKTDNDEDYLWKVNDALNNPGGSGSSGSSRGNGGGLSTTTSEQDMQALLSSMSQSQLMQLIGGMSDLGGGQGLLAQLSHLGSPPPGTGSSSGGTGGGSGFGSNSSNGATATRTAESTANSGGTAGGRTDALKVTTSEGAAAADSSAGKSSTSGLAQPIQLHDLQKILNTMPVPEAGAASSSKESKEKPVDLSVGVDNEVIQKIISNPKTVKKLAPLLPQFGGPPVEKPSSDASTVEPAVAEAREVEDTLMSNSFHSAVRKFCEAFPSGRLETVVTQLKMGDEAIQAAKTGNLEAFLDILQKDSDTQGVGGSEPSAPKATEEPEDMNLD